MKKLIISGLIAAMAAPFGFAQDVPAAIVPGYVNPILSEVKAGQAKRINYELEAVAYLLFIPVTGRARFSVDLTDDIYQMRTHVKTTGVADIFVDYDLHVASSGYILDDRLQTYNFVSQNLDGKKNRRVEMTYGADDVEMEASPAFGDLGFPPATPEQKLEALDPISGFISAAFKPRRAETKCGEPIKLFDGKQLTHMRFEYIGEADVRTKAWRGTATECQVIVDRVAGYDADDLGENLSGIEGPMRMFFGEPFEGFITPVKLVIDTEDIGRVTVRANRITIEDIEG